MPQRDGKRDDPLSYRYVRDNLLDEVGGGFRHTAGPTSRTKPSIFSKAPDGGETQPMTRSWCRPIPGTSLFTRAALLRLSIRHDSGARATTTWIEFPCRPARWSIRIRQYRGTPASSRLLPALAGSPTNPIYISRCIKLTLAPVTCTTST